MFPHEGFVAGRTLKSSGSVFLHVQVDVLHMLFEIRNSVMIPANNALRFLAANALHMTIEMIVP
jgi:hypothetical protein